MHKDKKDGIMIVFGGSKPEKDDYKQDKKEFKVLTALEVVLFSLI